MKKVIFVLILFLFPLNVFSLSFEINSKNVLLYNLNDESILYEVNSNERCSIASLTKIMTAIVALENIKNLEEKVYLVDSDFYGLYEANASVAGFKSGEEVTYYDLLCGLLLPSGADSALALSRLVAGSEDNFVNLMNQKKDELGMHDTNFVNTTGLDDDNHYSTLNDVYKMFRYAINNKYFLEIIGLRTYTTSNGRLNLKSTTKKLMDNYNISDMDYLIGGKTGSTGNAGLCYASLAEYNGVRYILVTTGAPYSRDKAYTLEDAKTIYEYFINNYSYKNIIDKGDLLTKIDVLYGKNDSVSIYALKDVTKYLDNSFDKSNIDLKYKGVKLITTKMNKGESLGKIEVYYNSEKLDEIDIKLLEKQEFSLYKYLVKHKIIVFISILSIIVIILILFKLFKKR